MNENISDSSSNSKDNINDNYSNTCLKLKEILKKSKTKKYILNNMNTDINYIFKSKDKNNNKNQLLTLNKNESIETSKINYNIINNSSDNKIIIKNNKCSCKNTNCLKFYCECFSNGRYCNDCSCCNCKNTEEFNNLRLQKYNEKISADPSIYNRIYSAKNNWTCHCKNSNCTKNYCDCFHNKKFCNSKCKCIECHNQAAIKNNNKKKKIQKRIRGIKNGKRGRKKNTDKNLISPKKKENKNMFYIYNQSTADYSENNNVKTNLIRNNCIIDKNVFQKLDMENFENYKN